MTSTEIYQLNLYQDNHHTRYFFKSLAIARQSVELTFKNHPVPTKLSRTDKDTEILYEIESGKLLAEIEKFPFAIIVDPKDLSI